MPKQLTQNPLEQFEPERLPVGWPWRLFSVSFIIFLAVLLVYFGLVFGYEPFLRSQIEKKDAEIAELGKAVRKEDQENFSKFYSKLLNLQNLLSSHAIPSKLFPFLERATHPRVYYAGANLKVPERELQLDGIADSYGSLGEQLAVFDRSADVERLVMNQSQLGSGGVQFRLTLKLKNELLKP